MSIWKILEKATTTFKEAVATEAEVKKEPVVLLPVPTIVVTPVLEEREEYLEFGYSIAADTPKSPSSTSSKTSPVLVQVAEVTPTPPADSTASSNDEATKGLGISGVSVTAATNANGDGNGETYVEQDPLSEVDDLLAILGLDIEAERDEVEDEVEKILEAVDANASKLVEKSRLLFLELSREWRGVVTREYLPAKREAKMIIWESYAMEEFKKPEAKAAVQISRDEKLFAAIVLADVATSAVADARAAAEKIHNIQAIALQKYATRLKDHKIIPLASYRRYVRRVQRMERETEGWRAKEKACARILTVGGRVLNQMGKEPGSPDSGYGE